MTRHLPLLLLVVACGQRRTEPPPEPTTPLAEAPEAPPPAPPGKAPGEACLAASECSSGVCEGQGCTDDQPGVCAAPDRMCTMDLAVYCGCDGQEFQSSGSCPGRRYASRGTCP